MNDMPDTPEEHMRKIRKIMSSARNYEGLGKIFEDSGLPEDAKKAYSLAMEKYRFARSYGDAIELAAKFNPSKLEDYIEAVYGEVRTDEKIASIHMKSGFFKYAAHEFEEIAKIYTIFGDTEQANNALRNAIECYEKNGQNKDALRLAKKLKQNYSE